MIYIVMHDVIQWNDYVKGTCSSCCINLLPLTDPISYSWISIYQCLNKRDEKGLSVLPCPDELGTSNKHFSSRSLDIIAHAIHPHILLWGVHVDAPQGSHRIGCHVDAFIKVSKMIFPVAVTSHLYAHVAGISSNLQQKTQGDRTDSRSWTTTADNPRTR